MFSSNAVLTTTRRMPFPAASILEIIQSPFDLIRLSPDVVGATPSPTGPSQWDVDSRLTGLGGLVTWTIRYHANFEKTEDGAIFRVSAGAGVTTLAKWTCKEIEGATEGGSDGTATGRWTEVTERAELTAPVFLLSSVTAARNRTHKLLMELIEKRLGGQSTD